jgi:pimeloyl-ACP methyl ester carboxylesterase
LAAALTLVYVPCFSGAPWELPQFPDLAEWPALAPALPEGLHTMTAYADWLALSVGDLPSYVLVGDSFGAAIALELATRQPTGLKAVVASGGFASNPIGRRWLATVIRHGQRLPTALYSPFVVPFHAWLLRSRFDRDGRWSMRATRRLFRRHTPAASYWARAKAALDFDSAARLGQISVPLLLLTPEDDRLIPQAASSALRKVPHATEVRMRGTGHMLRYSHPRAYGRAVAAFLKARGLH